VDAFFHLAHNRKQSSHNRRKDVVKYSNDVHTVYLFIARFATDATDLLSDSSCILKASNKRVDLSAKRGSDAVKMNDVSCK